MLLWVTGTAVVLFITVGGLYCYCGAQGLLLYCSKQQAYCNVTAGHRDSCCTVPNSRGTVLLLLVTGTAVVLFKTAGLL